MNASLQQLPIESLQRGRYQPRQTFASEAIQELAQSIRKQGLIEPLVVREIAPGRYEIIAGERRWRAAMTIGLTELPCLIGQYNDQQAAAVALIENVQRENLNLIEEASGYQRLLNEFHFNQDEIAILVGKSRSHIANLLRLLTLSPFVQEQLRSKQLTLGHARMLVGLESKQQETLTRKIQQQNWSVRRLEQEVRLCKSSSSLISPQQKSYDVSHLETQLAEQIGAPVQIISGDIQGGGWLKIKFYDNDTLSGLLERLGLRYD
ncbi:ParB/RepB/Spo0J family partition protein [Legionella oakridgensis]|uniref:ParB/RepB/Spo0J family partition protein n=1 Tax=Legionella oakridgensis TaxID=29423 RepID=UPI0003DE1F98|nr:ParB/RepB/Spo0J family partition protein [Legionella oakridgensis]ETO94028.1 ParB-like partition protein [Legionella oakridgensis RV-2-2007]